VVLSKETILPFLLLPLFTGMRRSRVVLAGLGAAAVTFVISGQLVEGYYSGEDASMMATILEHAGELAATTRHLFTPSGIHDFQNGFSLLLPLAAVGAWLNRRHRYHEVPIVVATTVPIALSLALMSGNMGRMFFAAFPAVIAYALIAVEHIARPVGARQASG
jgi:hypothetical protein